MSDEKDDEPEIHGFALPLPASLIAAARKDHDRQHMRLDQARMELYGFLDSLSPDQLLALRRVLNLDEDGVNYVDGMAAAQLRLVHKIDPDSGEELIVH